jgi:4a-hydroxytetrahydrobiopterin dehydratase
MSTLLAAESLTPCRKGMPVLSPTQVAEALIALPEWLVVQRDGVSQLQRSYCFHNYADALAFTNAVGAIAEAADHHPALTLEWGKVGVSWWTHVIHGLHRNDCIMAARTDACYRQQNGVTA